MTLTDPISMARVLIDQAREDAGENEGLRSLLDAADTILSCAERQKDYSL